MIAAAPASSYSPHPRTGAKRSSNPVSRSCSRLGFAALQLRLNLPAPKTRPARQWHIQCLTSLDLSK